MQQGMGDPLHGHVAPGGGEAVYGCRQQRHLVQTGEAVLEKWGGKIIKVFRDGTKSFRIIKRKDSIGAPEFGL